MGCRPFHTLPFPSPTCSCYTSVLFAPSGLVDPCDVSLCSHPKHECHVVEGVATCQCQEACPLLFDPVCASDGETYPNQCAMEVESCKTGQSLRVEKRGKCDRCPVFDPMPECTSIGGECSTDEECAPEQKCCLYKCNKVCVNSTTPGKPRTDCLPFAPFEMKTGSELPIVKD